MSYAIESIAKSIGARRVGKHKATGYLQIAAL